MNKGIGLFIPNSDYNFPIKNLKVIKDFLFIFTQTNELIVFQKKNNQIQKRFILFTSLQKRQEILDVFITQKVDNILENPSYNIVMLTKGKLIYFFNIKDGHCLSKANLNLKENIKFTYDIYERYLFIITNLNYILFDTFTHQICKQEKNSFNISTSLRVKENKFYLLSETEDTYILELMNLQKNPNMLNSDEIDFREIKLNFKMQKVFAPNNDCFFMTLSNYDLYFHSKQNRLKVSFHDSVEELTEISQMDSIYKFSVIYIDKFYLDNIEYLIVIYKDLLCEIFTYDKQVHIIKKFHKFFLMIEDKFFSMKYSILDNFLVGYLEKCVVFFDLSTSFKIEEKYSDFIFETDNLFENKINLTNYFKDNFFSYYCSLLELVNGGKINTHSKETIKHSLNFKVTASCILSSPNYSSIYYIFGTDTGKILIVDIFYNEKMKINPVIIIDFHQTPIEMLCLYEEKYLIASSSDGIISFTEITKEKIESSIQRVMNNINAEEEPKRNEASFIENYEIEKNLKVAKKKSISHIDIKEYRIDEEKRTVEVVNDIKAGKFKVISIHPIHSIHNYFRLIKISKVVQVDNFEIIFDEKNKKKTKNFLSFEMENCSSIILNMENLKTIYHTHVNKSTIIGVYLISYQKCLLYLFEDMTLKVINYATKTVDRIITNIDRIMTLLRVEDSLKLNFLDSNKMLLEDKATDFHLRDINPLTKDKEKQLIMKKFFNTLLSKRKFSLNFSLNKFEAMNMKKIESFIIDGVNEILNQTNIDERTKKILIMNRINFPLSQSRLADKVEMNVTGIENHIFEIGSQMNEFIMLNFEDYFTHLEKVSHDLKLMRNTMTSRINYFNFISLFRIWNLSVEQDINFINTLKIFQPMFDISFILFGYDESFSILLNESENVDNDFTTHFSFLTKYMSASEEEKITQYKDDKYMKINYIINKQPGYLTNLKNFQFSSNLSHLMNLMMFGSLMSILGYEDSNDIVRLISKEKKLIRSLSQKKYIKFSNLDIINKFLNDCIDNISLTNKDIILNEFFLLKSTSETRDPAKSNPPSFHGTFLNKVNRITEYLEEIYEFLFGEQDKTDQFYKLTKSIINELKFKYLSEFELSLILLISNFNSVFPGKIPERTMLKVSQLLILYIFKILNRNNSSTFSKNLIEVLSKQTTFLEKIYAENWFNLGKILIELYTSIKIPIDLDGLFKKYEFDNCIIIKSEDNLNFLKIMLAKILKNYSKTKLQIIMKFIKDELVRTGVDYDYHSYLLELLWILFREKNVNHVKFLAIVVDSILKTMSPQNKEMRNICLDNAKRVLSCLISNYPMINFHQNSQKLAVGTTDGRILIYDLTSTSLWKMLNGHSNEISGVTFDGNGNILVSYSSTEASIKFWKIGVTSFFSNFFTIKDGYYKCQKLNAISHEVGPEEKISNVKLQIMSNHENKVLLVREDKSTEVIKL